MTNTIDQVEIQHFSKDAGKWWDEDGPFAPLHRLNPVRLGYIKERICAHYGRDAQNLKALEGLSVLDIGCGGGLVCEPMSRMGADVTGADADEVAIEVAKAHAESSGLSIKYLNTDINALLSPSSLSSPLSLSPRTRGSGHHSDQSDKIPGQAGEDEGSERDDEERERDDGREEGDDGKEKQNDGTLFDIVLALEIIEHVTDPAAFVQSCAKLLKPGGIVIFSTLNRNPKSFILGIVAAEYILRWVPTGTHNWKKFLKPSELSCLCRAAELTPHDICGLMFHPLDREFKLSKTDIDVNYFMSAIKTEV